MIVLLPGATRSARHLAVWRDRLPAPVEILDVPGHGDRPPLAVQTLDALVDNIALRIPPRSLIVGESLGGLIALALAKHGHRAIALDPPLSTAKLDDLHAALRDAVAPLKAGHPYRTFIAEVFGVMPDGSRSERDYWPLLEDLSGPVDIVTGNVGDCVLDMADRRRLMATPNVRLHWIQGSHVLLDSNPDACAALILRVLQDGESPAAGEGVDRVATRGRDRSAGCRHRAG